MPRHRLFAMVACIAGIGLAGRGYVSGAAQPATQAAAPPAALRPAQPTRMGVVDLVKIFDDLAGCEAIRDLSAHFRKMRDDLTAEAANRRKELDDMKIKLGAYRPNSPDFVAMRNDVVRKTIEYSTWSQVMSESIDADRFLWTQQIYADVNEVVARIAARNGMELVVTIEPFEPAAAEANLQALQSQIRARKVIYYSPQIDITAIVIDQLNRDYQARGGKAGLSGLTPATQAAGS